MEQWPVNRLNSSRFVSVTSSRAKNDNFAIELITNYWTNRSLGPLVIEAVHGY